MKVTLVVLIIVDILSSIFQVGNVPVHDNVEVHITFINPSFYPFPFSFYDNSLFIQVKKEVVVVAYVKDVFNNAMNKVHFEVSVMDDVAGFLEQDKILQKVKVVLQNESNVEDILKGVTVFIVVYFYTCNVTCKVPIFIIR